MNDMLKQYIKGAHSSKRLSSETIITNCFMDSVPLHELDGEVIEKLSVNVAKMMLKEHRADVITEEAPSLNGKRILVSCFCLTEFDLDTLITDVFEMGKVAGQAK
jgi:hypothetical protein